MKMTNKGFAPICNLYMMRQLFETGDLGDYHFLSAKDILNNKKEWNSFYRNVWSSAEGDMTVIVSNNFENEMTTMELLAATEVVMANNILLKNYPNDARCTILAGINVYENLIELVKEDINIIGCVQGESLSEIILCGKVLEEFCGATSLGIPKQHSNSSRLHLPSILAHAGLNLPFHLLGSSEDIRDDLLTLKIGYNVVGMASSLPLRAGQEGYSLDRWNLKPPIVLPPKSTKWITDEPLKSLSYDNLRTIKNAVR